MSGLKIFVSSHKPCYEVKNDVFLPARQSEIIAKLLQGDAEDVFMAERADEYCELLTQYYAWKREDARYYGFGHYRRYFDFSQRGRKCALIRAEYLNARTAAAFGFTDEKRIVGMAEQYDVIAPVPLNYYIKSVYWQYSHGEFLHSEDLDAVLDILKSDFPEYLPAAEKYLKGHYLYTCNLFVMKRELFFAYSEWLFAILKKFYAVRGMAGYSAAERRAPGHLGERLFGIWLTRLQEQGNYKIAHLPIVLFENTSPLLPLSPAFSDGVPVFLRADGDGAALSAVTLSSLLSHADAKRRYDIIAFGEKLNQEDKAKFSEMVQGEGNFSLRFLDSRAYADEAGALALSRGQREALAVVSLPEQTREFESALVLGRRVLLRTDAAKLWDDSKDSLPKQCAESVLALDFHSLREEFCAQCCAAQERAMRAEEFLHTLRATFKGQSGEMPAVCFDGAKVPWKCADCPYAAEFLAEANKTSYAEQLRFYDKEGRKREKKTLFDKLFPQGSRRRSAAKKLFRR